MTFKTKAQLTETVFQELALVNGSSVQTYSEPIVYENIQASFEHMFKKDFWPHLTLTTFHTLDGAGGVITDTLTGVEDVTDIKWIRKYPYEEQDIIPFHSDGIFNDDGYLAYRGLSYSETGYETKRVIFNPVTSEDLIAIRARRMPDPFDQPDDVIPLDYLLMKHFVTAQLLAADGFNPNGQALQQALFEDRYSVLIGNMSDHPLQSKSRRFSREFTVAE